METRHLKAKTSLSQIEKEIDILKCIQHANIVSIRDVVQTLDVVYLFLTRVLGGLFFCISCIRNILKLYYT